MDSVSKRPVSVQAVWYLCFILFSAFMILLVKEGGIFYTDVNRSIFDTFIIQNCSNSVSVTLRIHYASEQSLFEWPPDRTTISKMITLIPFERPQYCPAAVPPYLERLHCPSFVYEYDYTTALSYLRLLSFSSNTYHSRIRIVRSSSCLLLKGINIKIQPDLPYPPPPNHSPLPCIFNPAVLRFKRDKKCSLF